MLQKLSLDDRKDLKDRLRDYFRRSTDTANKPGERTWDYLQHVAQRRPGMTATKTKKAKRREAKKRKDEASKMADGTTRM